MILQDAFSLRKRLWQRREIIDFAPFLCSAEAGLLVLEA